MPKERRKIIQAGLLWMAVQYTAIHSQNQAVRRGARMMISTPAREALNAKLSWQKLMLVLACNFKPSDIVVTLSYRNEDLPKVREDADRLLSNFIRRLRAERKAHKPPIALLYVRVTEGYHSDGRLHHHLIINATGHDYKLIRSIWKHGDNIEFERFGKNGFERWAKYLTKEPRIQGRRHVGDRTWRCSVGLKRPEPYYEYVSEGAPLVPPKGMFIIDKADCTNSYGRFSYMMARLTKFTTEK